MCEVRMSGSDKLCGNTKVYIYIILKKLLLLQSGRFFFSFIIVITINTQTPIKKK